MNTAELKLLSNLLDFIPSGRLIKKPDFIRTKDGVWGYDSKKDSVKEEKIYFTASKREVHGNGGIVPDIKVDQQQLSPIVINMIMKSMFFNFALNFASEHKNLQENFEIDDEIISEYKQFLKEKDFSYKTEAEEHIEALRKIIDEEKYSDEVVASFKNLEHSFELAKQNDFERNLETIKRALKTEIAAKFWGTRGKFRSEFEWVEEIKKAVEVLSNKKEYFSVLHVSEN